MSVIYRDDAIKALVDVGAIHPYRIPWKSETYDHYNEGWRDATDRAVQAVEALPDADDGWIPCSEHLPKKFSYYLVTLNNSIVDFCIWNENEFGMFSPKWCPCNEVTAWRELPKPYEPKDDGK